MGSKRRPLFKRAPAKKICLTEDDVDIIKYVGKYRFRRMSDILRRFSHRSEKHLRARVRLLYDHGYLDLPRAQLDDHCTTGKPEKIYALGDRGAQLIAELDGVMPPKSSWSDKNRSVKRQYIHHTLRIGDIEDAFWRAADKLPTIEVLRPGEILKSAPRATVRDPKPWHWQTHIRTADGRLLKTTNVPDAVLGLDLTNTRRRFYFFAEADRGTMPVVRSKKETSSIARKFEGYLSGFHADVHSRRYNINNLRFLIITTSQQRIETMLQALTDIAGDKDASMFLFADWHQVSNALHVMTVPWRDATGDTVSLIPPTPKIVKDLQYAKLND